VEVSSPFWVVRSTGPASPGGAVTWTLVASTGMRSVTSTSPKNTRTELVNPLPLTMTRCPPENGPCEGLAPVTW